MTVQEIMDKLSLDEKALLTAGADMWTTPPIERAGVPAIRVTDGPNGARGSSLSGACLPAGPKRRT